MRRKFVLNVLVLLSLIVPFSLVTPTYAEGGYVSKITVTRMYHNVNSTVTVWESGHFVNQLVKYDNGNAPAVTIYAGGASGTIYYQLIGDYGYNGTYNGTETSYTFYPWGPEGDYRALVDGEFIGGSMSNEFYLVPEYSDLIISAPSPNATPPFCVGNVVNWSTTVTNDSDMRTDSTTTLGYYLGTSASDFSDFWSDDGVGFLDPGASSPENENYTFVSGDVGTRYINVWADYLDQEEESDEGNNKDSYGPFNVLPVPVPDFSADITSGEPGTEVQFTDLSTGSPVSWLWNFGDSGTSTQTDPKHTYNSVGTYTVSLTVTNPCGMIVETKTDYINIDYQSPVADFAATSATTGVKPLTVSFQDQSTGEISSWAWSFGDGGTSILRDPNHQYTSAGTYDVSLTVNGPGGSDLKTREGYINVSEQAPVAEFSGLPITGVKPLTVQFTDESSGGPITSWSWDFGDAGTSTDTDPSYEYLNAGIYDVSMTVTGPGGFDTETKLSYIEVTESAVVAEFEGDPLSGPIGTTVTFTDQSSGSPTSWAWDFGDGGSSTEQDPSHEYTVEGTYNVSLTATGPGGTDEEEKIDYISIWDDAPEISQVKITNVRDISFVVSWLTNVPAYGYVDYGTTTSLGLEGQDDRGLSHSDDTHYVSLTGLAPETTYYFDVISGPTTDDNGGSHYQVTTGPTLSIPGSDTAYGQVFNSGGITFAEGTIAYMTLADNDGSGTAGQSAEMSSLVDASGYWFFNLGNARLDDYSGYFGYSLFGDNLDIFAQGGADGIGCLVEDTAGDAPASDVLLGSGCPGQYKVFLPLITR